MQGGEYKWGRKEEGRRNWRERRKVAGGVGGRRRQV